MDIICPGIPLIVTGRPHASSTAYALATAIGYTHPYEFSDLADLANTIQHDYEGNASQDTPLTKEQMLDALNKYGVKYIDMQSLVDDANNTQNYDEVRHEAASMNKNSVLQIFLLKTDRKLALAVSNPDANANPPMTDGPLLHPWTQGDTQYAIVRVGFATDKNIGRYYDTLLSSSPIEMPTPITWTNIVESGLVASIAVLSPSVQELPPSDFRYFGGLDTDGNPITNTWPKEIAQFDPQPAIDAINALQAALQQERNRNATAWNSLASTIDSAMSSAKSDGESDKAQTDDKVLDLLRQLGANTESEASATGNTGTTAQPTTPDATTTQPASSDASTSQGTGNTTQPLDPTNGTGSQLL